MIVNVRGTNGSGKSTVVRKALELVELNRLLQKNDVYDMDQRKPIGATYVWPGHHLFLAGHYGIKNGGMDTMRMSHVQAWNVVSNWSNAGYDVICEGKNQSQDVPCACQAVGQRRQPVTVVHLTTTLDQCIASVRQRGHTLSALSIEKTHRKCERDARRLEAFGIRVIRCDRETAVHEIRRLLCLT